MMRSGLNVFSVSMNIALPFKPPRSGGSCTVHAKLMAELRFAGTELSKSFRHRPGLNPAAEQRVQLLAARGYPADCLPALENLISSYKLAYVSSFFGSRDDFFGLAFSDLRDFAEFLYRHDGERLDSSVTGFTKLIRGRLSDARQTFDRLRFSFHRFHVLMSSFMLLFFPTARAPPVSAPGSRHRSP